MERQVLERLESGEPVKVSTLRTATAVSLPVLAGMVRKKWIARETAAAERDARRMERFAVLVPETRLPTLTQNQQTILAELAACGGEMPLAELRRRDLPSSTLQTLVRRGLVRIEERPAIRNGASRWQRQRHRQTPQGVTASTPANSSPSWGRAGRASPRSCTGLGARYRHDGRGVFSGASAASDERWRTFVAASTASGSCFSFSICCLPANAAENVALPLLLSGWGRAKGSLRMKG